MNVIEIAIRRATEQDAAGIAAAHRDSIAALGPGYYPLDVVAAWGEGLSPDVYVKAMRGGEAFFIATGVLNGERAVLGFATHRVDDEQDGASVYVRGAAARRGIGTALLERAEAHARSQGATSISIQASLVGVEFYRANGFEELGRGEAVLMSGKAMACVFMRKQLEAFTVRQAGVADIAHLARHRVGMFRDMGQLAPRHEEPLERATAAYLREALPRGEYLAWIAEDHATMPAVVGGAGVQLRPILPRPRPGEDRLEFGPEAIILNVYVERAWRRRGIAGSLMRAVLDSLAARDIQRIVLHASDDGRRLYERLGFVPTNEMRLVNR